MIDKMVPRTGRQRKEDNTTVNVADLIEQLHQALVVTKDAGVQLTGSTLDLRGLFANRPSASEVPAGTTYWAIDKDDDDELTASDGTNWVVK